MTNERWHHDNIVLMGDAAHTTHFTIGSGTSLAIEDAIGLAAKLRQHEDTRSALDSYASVRQAALLRPQRHARYSARWFENVPRYIDLEPSQFAVLLDHRFSRLLAHTRPRGYWRLYRAARRSGALRRLWRRWVLSGDQGLEARARPARCIAAPASHTQAS